MVINYTATVSSLPVCLSLIDGYTVISQNTVVLLLKINNDLLVRAFLFESFSSCHVIVMIRSTFLLSLWNKMIY